MDARARRVGATDCAEGERLGIANGTAFAHEILIEIPDIDAFVHEPPHRAPIRGHVTWLGERRPFEGGYFAMFVDTTRRSVKHMHYRIPFRTAAGAPMTMLGHKLLADDPGLDMPGDITTLFIHIYDRDEPGPDLSMPPANYAPPPGAIATGIIRIDLRDGIRSVLSFASPGASWWRTAGAIKKFLGFYGRGILELYVARSRRNQLALAVVVAALALVVTLALW